MEQNTRMSISFSRSALAAIRNRPIMATVNQNRSFTIKSLDHLVITCNDLKKTIDRVQHEIRVLKARLAGLHESTSTAEAVGSAKHSSAEPRDGAGGSEWNPLLKPLEGVWL